MRTQSRFAWFALFLATITVLFGAGTAFAATVTTPFGKLDKDCVNVIPAGGKVDLSSGIIHAKDGSEVGPASTCSDTVPSCSSGGGWYSYTWANAATISGMTQFDELNEDWTVPSVPNPPAGDEPLEYFFSSLQAISGGTSFAIIQPVLSWNYDDTGEWGVSSWGLFDCNASCTCSYVFEYGPYTGVNPGDTIGGTIKQYAGNLDAWQITTTDTSTGANAVLDVYNIPNSWPKFNSAQSAVNENYGPDGTALQSCADLPASNDIYFSILGLYQAGPNWNSFNNVSSSASWSYYSNPNKLSPNCSWNAFGSYAALYLLWTE